MKTDKCSYTSLGSEQGDLCVNLGSQGVLGWSPEIGSSVSAIEWVNCVLSCTECWGVYDKQGGTVENSN